MKFYKHRLFFLPSGSGSKTHGESEAIPPQKYSHSLQFIPSYLQYVALLRGKNIAALVVDDNEMRIAFNFADDEPFNVFFFEPIQLQKLGLLNLFFESCV